MAICETYLIADSDCCLGSLMSHMHSRRGALPGSGDPSVSSWSAGPYDRNQGNLSDRAFLSQDLVGQVHMYEWGFGESTLSVDPNHTHHKIYGK